MEALLIVGTVMGAVGDIAEGNAQAAQHKSAAAAAAYNAKIATRQGYDEQAHAAVEELAQRRRDRLALGEQAASLSQSGADLSGSAGLSLEQSATNAEFDALNIRYRGYLRSRAQFEQANLDRFERDSEKANAKSAKARGWLKAGTRMISGTANYMKAAG